MLGNSTKRVLANANFESINMALKRVLTKIRSKDLHFLLLLFYAVMPPKLHLESSISNAGVLSFLIILAAVFTEKGAEMTAR